MATQNINIGVNISDNGTAKKVVKNFEEITQAATQAQQAAQNINAAGGTAGSRGVAAKAAPSGSQNMTNQNYGSARGSAGLTGASARDFAAQSQGLGGLVRLYATYAANIFAVSAAFNALSNAIDTTNMVSGLNQLGAASGVALGSLSKDLVKATDGAISLREAMTATAKASSSGMNSEQILRMGVVAKQASQALGVDMSDAISRISRGITKLEPELLDELGLFTKTGKAAEEYARSVGKSVNELTDFERRASFANAVLAEGEAKFSSIKLDVNPYTKLLASIKDLAQVSLEFVNKGLAPIVGYLSNSPTALGVAIATLGAILVKQALPALGEFKAGLASAADRATQLSIQKAQDASKARLAIDANLLSKVEAMADDKVAAVDAAEQKIQRLESSGLSKKSAAYKLLQKDIADVTKADIDGVEARAKAAESGGDTKRAALYREVTTAVLAHKKAEEDLVTTRQALSKQLEKDAQGMTTYGMTVRAAEQAQSAATKANIISNAAYNGSLIGVTGSLALMRTEMLAAGIATNTLAGRLMLARGALVAFGGAVGTLMSALNPILLIITAVSFAFSLLDGAMSNNSRESASFSGSLDKLDSSTKHLGDTIDAINKKPFLERLSPESLKAKATALSEVSLAVSSTVNDLLKADKAASGWDRFFDGYKTVWGGDILSKAAKGLATGITESLSKLAGSPEAKALSKELSGILQIDTEKASFQEVEDAIKKVGRESPEALKLVEDSFKKIGLEAQVTASKGAELLDSFKKLIDIKQTIDNKFLPTDDVTKYGQELINTSKKLSIALEDPQQKLNAIIKLADNAVNIPGVTFEQITQLTKAADLAKDIQFTESQQLQNKQKLITKEKELLTLLKGDANKAKDVVEERLPTYLAGLDSEDEEKLIKLKQDLKDLKSQDDINIKVKTELVNKLDAYSKEVETINLNTFKTGADIVAKQISAEFIKAGKVVSDAYANIVGKTADTIKIKADADKALISAQIEVIKSQRDLTIATRENSLRMEEKTLREQISTGASDPEAQGFGNSPVSKLATNQQNLRYVEAAKKGDFSNMGLGSNVQYLKELNVEALNFANNMRGSAAQIANLGAQIRAIDINALDETTKVKFDENKKKLENEEKSLSLAKQQLDVQGKLNSQGNMAFLSAKQSLEIQQLALQKRTAMLAIEVEVARLNNITAKNSKASATDKKSASNRLVELGKDKTTLETQFAQQEVTLTSAQLQEQLSEAAVKEQETKKRLAENYDILLTRQGQQLTQEQKLLDLYSSMGVITDREKIKQKLLLEEKKAELDYEEKIASLKTSSSNQQLDALGVRETSLFAQAELTGLSPAIEEELDRIDEQRKLLVSRVNEEAKGAARVRDNTIDTAKALATVASIEETRKREAENYGIILAQKSEELAQEQRLFDLRNSMGVLSENQKIKQKFSLDQKRIELEYEEKIANQKNSASNQQLDALGVAEAAAFAKLGTEGSDTAQILQDLAAMNEQRAVLISRVNQEAEGAARLRDNTLGIAAATKEAALEQEKYNQRFNELLESSQRLGESLTGVFGDLGTKVGALVDTLVNVGIQNEKNNVLLAKNAAEQKKLNDIDDPLGLSAENQEKLNDLKDQEIKLNKKKVNDELAGNIKTVSGAKNLFKEKTFAYKALDRIEKAMHLYRLAMDAKELAIKLGNMIVGTTAKAGAEAAETGLTFGGTVARLPAYATEIYGKTIVQLGPIFGPAVATALVAAMFSMFGKGGGKSAPAFSMNSEQIQETQGTGTTYNSKGEKVSDIGGILGDDSAKANSVVKSLEILKNNSFESLDYDNKLLRSFENVALAIGKATNTVLTSGLRSVNPELTASLGNKTMGGSDIPVIGKLIIGKLISSIFGGSRSETRNITSQRLELSGTFGAIADDIGSGLRQVTDVLVTWTKKGGWFSKDKSGSYVQQLVGEVPEDINDAFRDIFQSFKEGYQDIAEMMGMGESGALTFVTDRLDTVELKTKTGEPLKFDYTGLKGDEVKAELEAYFSKINNIALKALFPEFSAFETAGEDYGTTVVRVLQNTKQVELALVSIGNSSTSAMKGLSGFTAADDLVKISGGIEAFVDSTKFFASNFLTEAERAVPVQAAVVKQLEDLGYSNIKTKDQFKSLIQSLNLTDAASQKTYVSLLELAPGFTETLKAIENSFAETKSKLKETSTAFFDFAKNIKTFREGLVLGAQSIATPSEKFAEARTQFDALYASALGGDKDAMSKLTGSASTLLDLGKTLYASGSEYTSLFNSISTRLADAEINAKASADVADLQLKALDSTVSILTSIDTNIALIANVPAKAAGGLARGMTLVGEMGPELVDFSYPGRVYTADQTAGMFSPVNRGLPTAEIVSELKQLKQELAQLRKDQQKQTGDLIISNYDAHSKSSEEIAAAIVTTGEDTMWTERSKSEIK